MFRCPNCGSTELITDASIGVVCEQCSTVIEDELLVNAAEFTKQSDGSSRINGQFVGEFSAAYNGINRGVQVNGSPLMLSCSSSSRANMLSKMKAYMNVISDALSLGDRGTFLVEAAHRLFEALQHRSFLKGRNAKSVATVCLYISCRKEKVPRFLVDFSEVNRVNMYDLARVYVAAKKLIKIQVPPIDAMAFIERYAVELEFEDKVSEICKTAKRIVKRLKKDFIDAGRKPAGICAAALYVAAKIHGFKRTIDQVVEVVKISQITLRNRLLEFENTPSSALTAPEFMKVDLPAVENPPCMRAEVKAIENLSERLEEGAAPRSQLRIEQTLSTEVIKSSTLQASIRKAKQDKFYKELEAELRQAVEKAAELDNSVLQDIGKEDSLEVENEVVDFDDELPVEQLIEQKELDNDGYGKRKRSDSSSSVSVSSDDDEINNILLNENEEKAKTAMFNVHYDLYFKRKAAKDKLSKRGDYKKRLENRADASSKIKEEQRAQNISDSAAMSLKHLIQSDKKLSDKINYEAIEDLFSVEVSNM